MYYQILENLPQIPKNLITKNLHIQEIKINQDNQESGDGSKLFPRSRVTNEMVDWVTSNITSDAISIDIAVTNMKSTSSQMHPHTDSTRVWTLMYILESGGPEHRTVFYKHRDPTLILQPRMNFTYDEVIEVDSIQIPLRTWVIINAQEIHSVENIPDTRIAFQIGMLHNPWE